MANSNESANILEFPGKKSVRCDFDLIHSLLRYVYDAKKSAVAIDSTDIQERSALQHTYYCRAALKRRLKQIAMHQHELQDQENR